MASLVESVEGNTRRYQALFAEAADDLMRDVNLFPPSELQPVPQDVFDVLRAQVRTHCLANPTSHFALSMPLQ